MHDSLSRNDVLRGVPWDFEDVRTKINIKLWDYTVQSLVVGSSNSDDGTYKTDKERSALKLKII